MFFKLCSPMVYVFSDWLLMVCWLLWLLMHVPVVGLVGSMNNAIFSTYMSITVTHMFTLQMEMKITLHCIDKAENRMKKTRREIHVSTLETGKLLNAMLTLRKAPLIKTGLRNHLTSAELLVRVQCLNSCFIFYRCLISNENISSRQEFDKSIYQIIVLMFY